jgi:hypothetical protein
MDLMKFDVILQKYEKKIQISLNSDKNNRYLTHCGRVTQIWVFTLQLCRTGDANLRF